MNDLLFIEILIFVHIALDIIMFMCIADMYKMQRYMKGAINMVIRHLGNLMGEKEGD